MAAANSRLPEIPTDIDAGVDYVQALVERYGMHANSTRAGIDEADQAGDVDTADLLTEISRELDKDLWFLQAHLQARGLAGRRRLPASQEISMPGTARCPRPGSHPRQRPHSYGR